MKKKKTSGELIKELRNSRRETQEQFASRLGVKRAAVSAWEKDDRLRKPSAVIYFKLASLARNSGEAAWFLERADLDQRAVFLVAEKIRQGRAASVAEGAAITVGPLPGSEDIGNLLLASERIPDPDFAYYFVADEACSQLIHLAGIFFLDTIGAGRSIAPFWEQLVLVKMPPSSGRRHVSPELPNYLLGKIWPMPNVARRFVCYSGFARLAGLGRPSDLFEGVHLGSWYHPDYKGEASEHTPEELDRFSDEAYRRGMKEMETDPGVEIVGRVVSWSARETIEAKSDE